MKAVLAIDQGTTGSTALLIDETGRVRSRGYAEFTQHFPRPGWVEHDAEEIWQATVGVVREALRGAEGAAVEAIGITNQRETVVLWDRESLEPVHRAIVWQDRRTTSICRELEADGLGPSFRSKTGLVLDPYFSGTKLTWLFREYPELRARAEAGELAAGTIDCWLIARLTEGAVHATDHTNASRTLMYDLHDLAWDAGLLDRLEVPEGILPEVRASSGSFGVSAGEATGLEAPISGVAGDQQAALFGQGCWRAGLAKNTYGTGAFLLLHTGDQPVASQRGLLTTVACDQEGRPAYALEGSIFIAGAAIQWLRDQLGIIDDAQESEALARSLSSNEGVYLVPAFVGLGAPHWEPDARGILVGLTRGTGREHLVRAALEAMAYGTRDVIEAMESDSGVTATELRVDGGATRNEWLMEFQAGIAGIPVRRPAIVETTALGAAGLAGLSSGVWDSAQDFLGSQDEAAIFEPHMASRERAGLLGGWRRTVEAAVLLARQTDD